MIVKREVGGRGGNRDGNKGKERTGNSERKREETEKTRCEKNGKSRTQNWVRNEQSNEENPHRNVEAVGVNSEQSGRHGQEKFFENSTWLTSNEAAQYLRLPSVGAIRVLVCKRRIPFYKLGRSLRFKRADLDRLLEASKHLGGF